MEILQSLSDEPVVQEFFLFGFLSYIVKIIAKPTKIEAKFLARFLTFFILFLVDMLKRWHKRNPAALNKHIDTVYSHVFHTRHYFIPEENGKIVVG